MPTYTITAPDGKTYEIEGPDGASQEDVAYAVLAKNPQAGMPPDPRKQGFTPALKAGYQRLKGDIGALAGRTGIMGTEAAEQYRAGQEEKARGLFTPTAEGWTDAPWQKTKETLGGSLPYMAAPIAAGGAAAFGGAPAAVGMGAAGLASGLQFTGTNLARQMDEGKRLKDTSLAGAAGAAVPQAALDMLSFKMAPGIRLLFTQAGKEIAPKAAAQIAQQSIKQVAADYAKATGTAMTAEGLTEAAQQVLERWQAGLNLTDEKAKAEYIDSLIGGAVLGGAMSPAGRFVERGREGQKQAQDALAAKKQAMQGRAAQEQRDAEAAKTKQDADRQDPAYAAQIDAQHTATKQKMAELQAQLQPLKKNAAPEQRAANKAITTELARIAKEELAPLTAEVIAMQPLIAEVRERKRAEGMSEQEYADEWMGTTPSAQKPVPAPMSEWDKYDQGLSEKPTEAATPAAKYVTERVSALENNIDAPDVKDYVEYLMQDPLTAAQVVAEQQQIPGLSAKQNRAVLGAITLQNKAAEKASGRLAKEAGVAAKQRTALVEMEEAEALRAQRAEQERIDAESRKDSERAKRVSPELLSLRRIADRPAPTAGQFSLFGPNTTNTTEASTPSSPALGQMAQKLRGEDVTHTAPEPTTPKVQRGGPAPFNLYPRVGEENTADRDSVAERVQRALLRDDLTPETVTILQRLDRAVDKADPQLLASADTQLKRLEYLHEGVVPQGARRDVTYQAFPTKEGAASVAGEFNRTDVATPAVEKKKLVNEVSRSTLRGPSAQPTPDTRATKAQRGELNALLRQHERVADENAGQMPLFEKEDKELGFVKTDRAAFERFVNSPFVRGLKKSMQAAEQAVTSAKDAHTLREEVRALTAQMDKLNQQRAAYTAVKRTLSADADVHETSRKAAEINEALVARTVDRMELLGHIETLQKERAQLQEKIEDLHAAEPGLFEAAAPEWFARMDHVIEQLQAAENERALLDGAMDTLNVQVRLAEAYNKLQRVGDSNPLPSELTDAQQRLDKTRAALTSVEDKERAVRTEKDKTAGVSRRAKASVDTNTARTFSERMSDAKTRTWNAFHSGEGFTDRDGAPLPPVRYRALTPEERKSRGYTSPEESRKGDKMAQTIAGMGVKQLAMELGRVEKTMYKWTEVVRKARKNTGRFVGGEQNVVTYPHMASAIKQQALLSVKADLLEEALAERRASEAPRSVRAGEVSSEQLGAYSAGWDTLQQRQDKLKALETKHKGMLAEGADPLDVRALQQAIAKAREAVLESRAEAAAEVEPMQPGRVTQAARNSSAASGKLRAGTEESKRNVGVSRRGVQEARNVPQPTAKQAVSEGNTTTAEREAAAKPLSAKAKKAQTAERAAQVRDAAEKEEARLRGQLADTNLSIAAVEAKKPVKISLLEGLKRERTRLERLVGKQHALVAAAEDTGSGIATVGEPEDTEYSMAGENEARTLYRTSTKTGPSIKIATIEKRVAQMTEGWEKLPTITVVQSETDMPQRIQDQAARDKKTGAIPGLFDPDSKTVYLVADNLRDESDIALTVMHEVAGHFGLRGVLGGEYSNTMRRMYEGNAPLREAVNAKMKAEPNLSKDVAVEEVLAEAAESGPLANNKLSNALHNVYYAIKQFLFKKLGLKSVSDREVQQVVANARRYVKQGVGGKGGTAESTGAVYRTPSYGEQADTPLADLADKMVARPKTFKEKFLSNMGLGFEMQAVDMRAPIREMLKLGAHVTPESEALGMQAMYNVTKSDQRVALLMTAMSSGPLETYTDGKGFHGVRSTGENSAKDVFTAIADLPGGNERGKMAMATTYMIAQRAANVGIEKAGFGDMAITQAELDAVMAQVKADPELKTALEGVRKKYNAYNKGMIEFLADTGAIPKALAKELLANEDYVPFYRVNNNGMADLVFSSEHTIALGDIRHQPYLQSLKGGDTKILPLNESLSRNTTLLIDKAMTNLAAKGFAYAAQEMGAGKIRKDVGNAPAGPDIIRFNQEPDAGDAKDTGARWMRVNTEGTVMEGVPSDMVVKSLEGSHVALPAFLKLGAYAGDILRSGITRTPLYVMRQLIRDPMAATFTSGLPNNPMTAVYKAGKEFLADSVGTSEAAAKLIKKGIIQSGIFTGDHDDIAKFSLQLASGKDQNAVQRLFAMLDRAAMRADASTRVLVHENALKQGLSEVEADMMTMESMNFHKRGLSPSVQYANRLIPFFNAQIQGLNVLYKAARGRMPYNEQLAIKTKFFNNAMILFGTGLVYAAAMEDDEDFRNAKPRDRYSNFFVSLPGVDAKLKIPLPYEMGFIFSAAVAAVDGMREDVGGGAQAEALFDMLTNSIPGASSKGVPQLVKPVFETWTNTNFFSGQAIESASQKNLTPEERYSASTSEMAKALSKALPVLSPLQIEHLVKGYFGIIPLAIANTANGLFATDDTVERPAPRITDTPLIGAAFQRKFGGGDADAAYTIAEDVRKVEGTFKKMQNEGRRADVQEFLEKHIRELRLGPAAKQFEVRMAKIKDQEMKIRASSMSADTKRERIDALDKIRQDTAASYLKVFRQIEERSAA